VAKLPALVLGLVLLCPPAQAGEPPNLLDDPGFEEGPGAWHALGNKARYEIVPAAGRNGGACLRYKKEQEAEGKENSHYDQVVDVEPNNIYTAGAWFRGDGNLRPVLRIATMDWQTMALAVSRPVGGWQKVETFVRTGPEKQVRFQVFGGSLTERRESAVGTSWCDDAFFRKATDEELRRMRRCRVEVDAGNVLREINPLFFGVNSLFMVEDDASRADGKIAKYLREMPCRLIRYPGGEMADNYHWKTHRLDDPKKWPFVAGPQTMDTDEFMSWCREIGAEPIFVVNLESSFIRGDPESGIREAAEWVRYCNKEKGYGVKYWEIGNETYLKGTQFPMTAAQYADAFVGFSRAMKAVDAHIKIGAVGPFGVSWVSANEKDGSGPPWWPTIVKTAGADMDFAVIHRYHRERSYKYEWHRLTVGRLVSDLRRFLRESLPGRDIEIALTEWNAGKGADPRGMVYALVLAELAGGYIEGGVDLATFWPLRLGGKAWAYRCLLDRETNEPRAAYHVMKLLSSNMGDRLLGTTSSNLQVYAFASLAKDGKELALFLVNKSLWKEGVEVEILLRGFDPAGVKACALTAPEPASEDLKLVDLPLVVRGRNRVCTVPPCSIALVKYGR